MKVSVLTCASWMFQPSSSVPLWSQAPASSPSSQSSYAWPPASVSSLACSDHALSHPWASTGAQAQGSEVSQHPEAQVHHALLHSLLLSWPLPWWSGQEEFSPPKISAWLFYLSPLLLRRLVCDYNNSINQPKVFKSICQSSSQPG